METISTSFNIEKTLASKIEMVDWENIGFGRFYSDHMAIVDCENGEWKNCKILPFQNMSFSPAMSGIHYGQSIFEGMKAFLGVNGEAQLFRPLKNLERFNKSALRMGMPEVPEEIFMKSIEYLVDLDYKWIPKRAGSALYIRPFMFATDRFIGVKPSENFRFVIITCPVDAYYSEPVKVLVADEYVRAIKGGVGEAKAAGNYAATMMPVVEAKKQGFDQILWMDPVKFKYAQEIGTMNFFVVIDGIALTPNLNGAILEGITRDSVIEILNDKGIPCEQRDVSIDEIIDAHRNGMLEDAFGTGTAATISHIECLGYKGNILDLPPVRERKISNMLKKELSNIKTGKTEDKFKWIHHL
jgi:branched-chain amino acid aminotransferase